MIETKKSFCRFCHASCGIEVDVEDNRVVAVRGDRDNPVSRGYTCIKGRSEIERIYHSDRLLSPKKRVNGQITDISSEQALDEIADKLKEIVDKYGPRSIAVYTGCGGFRNSTASPTLGCKFLEAFNSPSFYTCYTVDSPCYFVSWDRLFGGVVPVNLFDIERADVALFAGTNPFESVQLTMPQSDPIRRLKDAKKRGMKVVVIDPRRSYIAKQADIYLQVKPGEDCTLLAGIIKIIIEKELYNKEYVQDNVSGLDKLYESVKDYDLEYVSKRTQVPEALVQQAAEMYASAKSGGALSGAGIHISCHQNLGAELVMILNALCGRFDRQGGVVRNEGPLGIEIPEGMGPVPISFYTDQKSRMRGIQGTYSLLGGTSELPSNCLADEILTPGEGQIRALIVYGGNPALVLPEEESVVRALKDLELLVVSDLYMSATAKFADYVFGVKHPYERSDIPKLMDIAFPFPFGMYTPALVDAPEGVLDDWEVFWELARRLELNLNIPNISMDSKPDAHEVMKGLLSINRIPLDEIREYPEGHVWGEKELKFGGAIPNMISHKDRRIAVGHPEIVKEIREVRAEPVIEGGGYKSGEDFSFRLIGYRLKESYCTQGQYLPSIRAKRPFNPLLMNPEAMQKLGIKDDDIVVVDSGFGTVEAVVESTEDLKPDVVGLTFGWGDPSDERGSREKGSNVQRLIPDDVRYDSVTGLQQMTAFPVNIRTQKS